MKVKKVIKDNFIAIPIPTGRLEKYFPTHFLAPEARLNFYFLNVLKIGIETRKE